MVLNHMNTITHQNCNPTPDTRRPTLLPPSVARNKRSISRTQDPGFLQAQDVRVKLFKDQKQFEISNASTVQAANLKPVFLPNLIPLSLLALLPQIATVTFPSLLQLLQNSFSTPRSSTSSQSIHHRAKKVGGP